MGYQRNLSGSCCAPCVTGMGAVDLVATGIDTAVRPGESVYDYMARISKEQRAYIDFVEAQRAKGVVVSQPLLPPSVAPASVPGAGVSRNTKLLLAAGAGLALLLLLRRK